QRGEGGKPARPKKEKKPKKPFRPTERPQRAQRGSEEGMRRLFINAGSKMRIGPGDLVGTITDMTGLKGDAIGAIEIFDKHSIVDVAANNVDNVIEKIDGIRIKGRRINVELAGE